MPTLFTALESHVKPKRAQICVTSKALQTAEHLLLCRYLDYRRSNYHKTVAAFELVLKDIIEELLNEGLLEASAPWVSERIRSEKWANSMIPRSCA